MIPSYFIYFAAALRIFGGVSYLRATLRGEARPSPLSWLLWGIIPLIAFAAEISAGVGLVALVTLSLGISPLLVFATAMIKNPKSFKLDGFNILCIIIVTTGVVLWQTADTPEIAIAMAIFADVASVMPTLRKVLNDPYSEHLPTYAISATAMIITLLTINDWRFAVYAFPVYVLVINCFIVLFVIFAQLRAARRRRAKIKHRKRKS